MDEIEKEVENKLRALSKRAYKKYFAKRQEKLLKEKKLTKKAKVSRYLYTIFGLIRFSRYRLKDKMGKFFYALDKAVSLEANLSFSPRLKERITFLCSMYP